MLYQLARFFLFRLAPETAHHVSLKCLGLLSRFGLLRSGPNENDSTTIHLLGLDFPNGVGLAAGLDKNGEYIDALGAMGFGFIEVGTVTPRPQPGNPKPRLFRLPAKKAIINRMGFNNLGVDYLVENVKKSRFRGPIGINIGKNFDTPVENAADDYLLCMKKVFPYADYITVNVSSPNTPGLRSLQFGDSLNELLKAIKACQRELTTLHGKNVPVLIKIAPDMSEEEIKLVAAAVGNFDIDGVIATNTTLSREGVEHEKHGHEAGGLSGAPLTDRSTSVIEVLRSALPKETPVIGVGGIMKPEHALDKQRAGANLVQIYTGFIYQGPTLVKSCVNALRNQNCPRN